MLLGQDTSRKTIHELHIIHSETHAKSKAFKTKGPHKELINKIPSPKSAYEIFGWYPNWDTEYYKSLNYDLLTTIAYFAYEVNPQTGNASKSNDWNTTPLVDSVKKHGKKIMLTATNFGSANKTLLHNETATKTLINNLIKANQSRNANGICIDFEGLQNTESQLFVSFIRQLKLGLQKADPANQLYITLPAVDWSSAFLTDSLEKYTDKFVIMGYDYYYPGGAPGPNSPLDSSPLWGAYSLKKTLQTYINDQHVQPSKLILALPFYGQTWGTESPKLGTKESDFVASYGYSYIRKNMSNYKVEPQSKSTYSIFTCPDSTYPYHQCWFEGDSSFAAKVNLIKDSKLAGLGIWALGYEAGYKDLWITIVSVLGTDDTSWNSVKAESNKIDSLEAIKQPQAKNPLKSIDEDITSIFNYSGILQFTLSMLSIFGILGILIGFLFSDVRVYFFSNALARNTIVAIVLLLTISALSAIGWLNTSMMTYLIGFTIGAITYAITSVVLRHKKNNLP